MTALAQEVTDILYRHMEEQEQEASKQLPVANHNVFAFAADARVNGAGRGAQAIQPAWMTSQSFQF